MLLVSYLEALRASFDFISFYLEVHIMPMYYAGIGSRQTPRDILAVMTKLATVLEHKGYILRTGDAKGADAAFRAGCSNKQVYTIKSLSEISEEMRDICYNDLVTLHPNVRAALAKPYAKEFLMRDSLQVRGNHPDDTLSHFIVCWTKNAGLNGGTAQAMRVANKLGVEIYNLANPNTLQEIVEFINANL